MKKAEEELAVKEEKLDALKQELLRPEYQSSYSKLTEIQGEIDALEEEIMADMENWEELSQQHTMQILTILMIRLLQLLPQLLLHFQHPLI